MNPTTLTDKQRNPTPASDAEFQSQSFVQRYRTPIFIGLVIVFVLVALIYGVPVVPK